ncbi:MAG: LD-carboxypeptidase [Verrucomicrobia bacterium]|nr:LD-carboxypeptidase [Chloroflexota bacterium]MBU1694458.1 LD-carboxypeptidase [Verrucomicrobiota bacterium]MBU1880033.1 LD-carboxypeptidase [Chloroflexota bacterium]
MIATKLNRGDRIGVVSPSDPVPPGDPQFDRGVRFLEDMGFRVVLGQHVFSNTWGYAASPQDKAGDVNAMFAAPAIRAILCSQGGDTANACLSHLDWETIAQNPKVLLGISDITVLLNAIYARTSLVTFHGDDVMWGFGRAPSSYTVREFVSRLVDAEIGLIPTNGTRATVRGGRAEGRLLGGNLNGLLKLAGTPYFPDLAGAILFVEGINLAPAECDFKLHQLAQIGVFDRVRGVLVGYIDGLDNRADEPIKLQDILLRVTSEYEFPILKVDDFGHNCPNTVLPVGARVRIDADRQEIEILEACVRSPHA